MSVGHRALDVPSSAEGSLGLGRYGAPVIEAFHLLGLELLEGHGAEVRYPGLLDDSVGVSPHDADPKEVAVEHVWAGLPVARVGRAVGLRLAPREPVVVVDVPHHGPLVQCLKVHSWVGAGARTHVVREGSPNHIRTILRGGRRLVHCLGLEEREGQEHRQDEDDRLSDRQLGELLPHLTLRAYLVLLLLVLQIGLVPLIVFARLPHLLLRHRDLALSSALGLVVCFVQLQDAHKPQHPQDAPHLGPQPRRLPAAHVARVVIAACGEGVCPEVGDDGEVKEQG
mmetsp:Transcript_95236/g.269049  ORF Transcript_95236/g.269049 Transcript_95236/m.269049 type:complete len:283 (+) Transcript_95236:1657-2505(+)